MFNHESLNEIPFLKAIGEVPIVKSTIKLQIKLQNRGIRGIYLGPSLVTFYNITMKGRI